MSEDNGESTGSSHKDIAAKPMIMDLGMYNGFDSRFYLRKGFRVVAVEANPVLAARAKEDLAEYIESGQLVVESIGLGMQEGQFPFYLNLDNGQWSSFVKAAGTRDNTRYEVITVQCVQPQWLFERYGMPYYLKIDIEGFDIEVVRALHDFTDRPRYVSIEDCYAFYFAELWGVGCRAFKLVDQVKLLQTKCPFPALEGEYIEITDFSSMSGPFGEEAPGEWMTFDQVMEKYLTEIRSPSRGWLGGEGVWFDIHGRIE